jgi:hypothetical protein
VRGFLPSRTGLGNARFWEFRILCKESTIGIYDRIHQRFGTDYPRARRHMIAILRARPELEGDEPALFEEVRRHMLAEHAAHDAYQAELQRRREARPGYVPPPPPGYGVGGGGN